MEQLTKSEEIICRPRGTQDTYPPRSLLYHQIHQITTEILIKNNYQPIIFPTLEYEQLFTGSLGATTDIIHKEMYTFFDRKGRKLALRPEGTISTARLICQNKLLKEGYSGKFYYWANMFRYERPQKERNREFWQLGVELINAAGVQADYQIIKLVCDILTSLGIKNFTFSLNYLGDRETQRRYQCELKKTMIKNNFHLCDNCSRRYNSNPLRILDCSLCKKNNSFPVYKSVWTDKDDQYVTELNKLLKKFNLPYHYDYNLVRGLDYYTGLVFEVNLKGEKTLLGGGRYDKLYERIGKLDLPAIGFAIGIERLTSYLTKQNLLPIDIHQTDVFLFATAAENYEELLMWKKELAKYQWRVDYNLELRKVKTLSKIINYYQPKLLVLLGEKELKSEQILVKDCQKKQDYWIKKKEIVKWINAFLIKKS